MVGLGVGEHDLLVVEAGAPQAVHVDQLRQLRESLHVLTSRDGEHGVGHCDQAGQELPLLPSLLTPLLLQVVVGSGTGCVLRYICYMYHGVIKLGIKLKLKLKLMLI